MTRHAESSDVLTGGEWVVVRGVSRWVPQPPPAPQPPSLTLAPTPAAPAWTQLIACLECGAKVTETCKSPGGKTRPPHPGRLVARVCKCGADLAKFKNYCEPCRVEARRETSRSYMQRKRSPLRKAS